MLKTILWAKSSPHKSLVAHMIDTGVCAQAYLSAPSSSALLSYLMAQWHCSREEAISRAAYLCAVHDLGKAYPAFQAQDEGERQAWREAGLEDMLKGRRPERFRHEYYGQRILGELWTHELGLDSRLCRPLGRIVSAHHQKRDGERVPPIHGRERVQFWQDEQRRIERELRAIFLPGTGLALPGHLDAGCTILLGLMILCDWVASSKPFEALPEDDDYAESARRLAERTLADYGLIGETPFPQIDTFRQMWPEIGQPRPLQQACSSLSDRALLTIVEAPMGEGKTEAALYLAGRLCSAFHKRGVYVALPTQATSNSMNQRVGEMLQRIGAGGTRLMHGTAFLLQDALGGTSAGAPEEAADWLRPMRLALLGGSAVGTVDQAMAAVLRVRFSVLRLLGLQNKVLVIDEVHAYDSYMSTIIETLLRWCRALEIPVILLSATMRSEQRAAYLACFGAAQDERGAQAYPLITQVDGDGRTTQVQCPSYTSARYVFRACGALEDMGRIAQLAVQRVQDGGCICVLMNTVRQAQEVYREIQRIRQADCRTLLFHARYTVERRAQIEQTCLDWFGKASASGRPRRAILVATAVVEQSLDLDFDAMLTQIAPMDLLLQRAGRVHRHHGRQRPDALREPVIDVLVPDAQQAQSALERRYGLSGCVYDPFLLDNTQRLIGETRVIRVPEDIRAVIEAAYHGLTGENMAAFLKRQTASAFFEAQALSCCIQEPDPESFQLADSASEWDIPEIDDGFEQRSRPSTRLGDSGVRVIFCDAETAQRALDGRLTPEEERRAFLKSASLPLTRLDRERDIRPREIPRGMLKGCVPADSEASLRIGDYALTNDPEYGIVMTTEDEQEE